MGRFLVEADGPDLPVIIQVQHGFPIRRYHRVVTAGIVKPIVIPIIFRIREPVRHLPGPLHILPGSRYLAACSGRPHLGLPQQRVSLVLCVLHPPQHSILALPRLPEGLQHSLPFRHHLRQLLIPSLENVSLPDRFLHLPHLVADILARPAVQGRDISSLRLKCDPVIKKSCIVDLLRPFSVCRYQDRHILPRFFLTMIKIPVRNIYPSSRRRLISLPCQQGLRPLIPRNVFHRVLCLPAPGLRAYIHSGNTQRQQKKRKSRPSSHPSHLPFIPFSFAKWPYCYRSALYHFRKEKTASNIFQRRGAALSMINSQVTLANPECHFSVFRILYAGLHSHNHAQYDSLNHSMHSREYYFSLPYIHLIISLHFQTPGSSETTWNPKALHYC